MSKSKNDIRPTGKGKTQEKENPRKGGKRAKAKERVRERKRPERETGRGKREGGENEEAGEMKGISFSPWMPARVGYRNLPIGTTDPDPEGENCGTDGYDTGLIIDAWTAQGEKCKGDPCCLGARGLLNYTWIGNDGGTGVTRQGGTR